MKKKIAIVALLSLLLAYFINSNIRFETSFFLDIYAKVPEGKCEVYIDDELVIKDLHEPKMLIRAYKIDVKGGFRDVKVVSSKGVFFEKIFVSYNRSFILILNKKWDADKYEFGIASFWGAAIICG